MVQNTIVPFKVQFVYLAKVGIIDLATLGIEPWLRDLSPMLMTIKQLTRQKRVFLQISYVLFLLYLYKQLMYHVILSVACCHLLQLKNIFKIFIYK